MTNTNTQVNNYYAIMNFQTIVNCLDHEVTLWKNGRGQKPDKELITIFPSGLHPYVDEEEMTTDHITTTDGEYVIPIRYHGNANFHVYDLPPEEEGYIYIVDDYVAEAMKNKRFDFYTVSLKEAVWKDGKLVGFYSLTSVW